MAIEDRENIKVDYDKLVKQWEQRIRQTQAAAAADLQSHMLNKRDVDMMRLQITEEVQLQHSEQMLLKQREFDELFAKLKMEQNKSEALRAKNRELIMNQDKYVPDLEELAVVQQRVAALRAETMKLKQEKDDALHRLTAKTMEVNDMDVHNQQMMQREREKMKNAQLLLEAQLAHNEAVRRNSLFFARLSLSPSIRLVLASPDPIRPSG